MVARRRKETNSKVRNNKTMLKILSFIRCFCSLKFEKVLFSNKFFSFVFRSKMIVNTAKNDQIKYFTQK